MVKSETGKNITLSNMKRVIASIIILGMTGCISLFFGGARSLVIIIVEKIIGRPLNYPDNAHLILLRFSSIGIICLSLILVLYVTILFWKQITSYLARTLDKLYGFIMNNYFIEQPFFLILFIFILYLVKNIFLVLQITGFDIYIILLSIFMHILVSFFCCRHRNNMLFKYLLICYAILIISLAVSSLIYDFSWDGLAYHQTGAIKINEGWNPFYENLGEDLIWNNHYPKFTEIYTSIFLSAFGNIEMGKSYNILFLVILFFYACKYTGKFQKNRTMALLISMVFIANPVVLAQLFTFYVDGAMGMMIVILIFACMDYEQGQNGRDLLIVIAVSVFSLNTKFTGFICGPVLISYILKLFAAKKYRQMLVFLMAGFSIVILGVVFTGYNPYIVNTRDFGHPFYPLYGNEAVDIISSQMSEQVTFEGFVSMNPVKKFFTLFFLEFNFKTMPFSPWKLIKFVYTTSYDQRIGGFGVFLAEFSIILLPIMIITIRKKKTANYRKLLFPIFILLFISIVTPENWWARYIPFFWYLFGFLIMASDYSQRINKKLLLVCLLIANVNCVLFLFDNSITGVKYTWDLRNFMTEINKSGNDTVHIVLSQGYFKYTVAEKIRFYGIEKNIVFIQDEETEFTNGIFRNIIGWY